MQAMTWAISRLKQYKTVPPNGLAVFTGLASLGSSLYDSPGSTTDEYDAEDSGTSTGGGKTKLKKISLDVVPLLPLKHGMYYCDNRFHPEELKAQLTEVTDTCVSGAAKKSIGYVIMNGDGALLGKLQGSQKSVLAKLRVSLPKKHHKGGQSSVRFERLRKEAVAKYVKIVAEQVNKTYIVNDEPIVSTMVYAGFASLKNSVSECPLIDYRLQKLDKHVLDLAYGFEAGFDQAIAATTSTLKDIKYNQERELITSFMETLGKESNKVVYGVKQVMAAIELGACDRLILWDELPLLRVTPVTAAGSGEPLFLKPEEFKRLLSENENTSVNYQVQLLLEWIVENHQKKGADIEIVSGNTPESKQFIMGFAGIAGFLRYDLPSEVLQMTEEPSEFDDLDGFE